MSILHLSNDVKVSHSNIEGGEKLATSCTYDSGLTKMCFFASENQCLGVFKVPFQWDNYTVISCNNGWSADKSHCQIYDMTSNSEITPNADGSNYKAYISSGHTVIVSATFNA